MWFKVDGDLSGHPKVVAAGNAAMGLWVRAGSWSAHYLTNGLLPDDALPQIGTPTQAERLAGVGLWTRNGHGWEFHDWKAYQPSGRYVDVAKEARMAAAAKTNHMRWHVGRGVIDPDCPLCQTDP